MTELSPLGAINTPKPATLGLSGEALRNHMSKQGRPVMTVDVKITDDEGKEIDAQPGLSLFTGTHYSIMFVPGSEPRGQYVEQTQTEADRLIAYNSFVANSGRYDVSGDQLTLRAYVAKDPNYMAAFPENQATAKVHIAGGDTLHLTYTGEFFISGTMFTLRRVEGAQVPWESD